MRHPVNVTELQRNFSDFLNRVGYRGESFLLLRGGRPVAELTPAPAAFGLGDLPGLLTALPPLAADDDEAGTADPPTTDGSGDDPAAGGEAAAEEHADAGDGRPAEDHGPRGILLHHSVLLRGAGRPSVLEPRIRGREEVPFHLSVITVGEMLRAARQLPDPVDRARHLAFGEAVAGSFPLLSGDLPTARSHAELWGRLGRDGVRLGPHELWLLSVATAHGLTLATADPGPLRALPPGLVEDWS